MKWEGAGEIPLSIYAQEESSGHSGDGDFIRPSRTCLMTGLKVEIRESSPLSPHCHPKIMRLGCPLFTPKRARYSREWRISGSIFFSLQLHCRVQRSGILTALPSPLLPSLFLTKCGL